MKKLTLESNYSPFAKGYYIHILYLLMPIAFFIAHSVFEASYKVPEYGMYLIQADFESKIPYLSFMSIAFYVAVGCVAAMTIFLMIKDVCAFKRFSVFLYIGLFVAIIISACFPNYNTLQPDISSDNSFFGGLMKIIYGFDSYTNNFPSSIAIVSFSLIYASFDSKLFKRKWIKILSIVMAVIFIASSLFIKLNSVFDILGSGAICLIMLLPISLIKKRDMLRIGEEKYKFYGQEDPYAKYFK